MAYPCECSPCSQPGCVTVPDCTNCLKAASLIIDPLNAVGPCGQAFTVDIGAESDLDYCTTGVNWYILSWDEDAFSSVSINSSGVLSATTTSLAAINTFYTFTGKVTCNDTLLSQYFTVQYSVKNLCLEQHCASVFYCNPCTGLCVEDENPDVELS